MVSASSSSAPPSCCCCCCCWRRETSEPVSPAHSLPEHQWAPVPRRRLSKQMYLCELFIPALSQSDQRSVAYRCLDRGKHKVVVSIDTRRNRFQPRVGFESRTAPLLIIGLRTDRGCWEDTPSEERKRRERESVCVVSQSVSSDRRKSRSILIGSSPAAVVVSVTRGHGRTGDQ